MKKLITLIISVVLAVGCVFGLVACTSSDWTKPTLTNPGSIVNGSTGSFYAETQNYVYYINGIGDMTKDNTFGVPVKGALMAVEKSSIKSGDIKTEVVVPKLFVSSDSDAGFYLFGSGNDASVYYGSPSTDKNSSGEIAKTDMTFLRTTLDSKTTEKLFTVSNHSTEYRMAEKDGVVYIVFYDSADSALKVYDTASKKVNVIAKTDEQNNDAVSIEGVSEQKYLSLDKYKFLDNGNQTLLVYTMTVYAEKYYEDKAEQTEYTRATEAYNLVYEYSLGSTKLAINGATDSKTYEITFETGEYLFYKEKDKYSNEKTFGTLISQLGDLTKRQLINDNTLLAEGIVIKDLDTVYRYDSTNKKVYRTSLTATGNDLFNKKQNIIPGDDVSTLIDVDGDYVYYFDGSNQLARRLVGEDTLKELISDSTASKTFYAPARISIDDTEYMFYIDSSTKGANYVEFVSLSAELEEVDTNEDEKIDHKKFNGQKMLGKYIDQDKINIVEAIIDEIGTAELEFIEADGKVSVESVTKARKAYNDLEKGLQEKVLESKLSALVKAEKAVELANKYYALRDVDNYVNYDETQKAQFKSLYQQAFDLRDQIIQENGKDYYTAIRTFIAEDYKYYYGEAYKLFKK